MTEDQKKKLEQKLWSIANELRGRMDADEFRDYILGFIFYKYLSERLHLYADDILKNDGRTFKELDASGPDDQKILQAVEEACIEALGYFLKPEELFTAVAHKGSQPGSFILEDLTEILNNIQRSTMGTQSEEDFDNLFEDLDLTSTKLGRTNEARNTLISKVLVLTGSTFSCRVRTRMSSATHTNISSESSPVAPARRPVSSIRPSRCPLSFPRSLPWARPAFGRPMTPPVALGRSSSAWRRK